MRTARIHGIRTVKPPTRKSVSVTLCHELNDPADVLREEIKIAADPGGIAACAHPFRIADPVAGVIVISDEIHSDFTWGENKHLMFASLSDDFANISITCTAPSKTFNLAGLQVSNIFIPNETLRFKFKKAVDAAGYSQVNVMGLEACQAAYEYGEEWLTQLKEYLKDNIAFVREFIQTRLPKLTMIEPEGTYLLWIDFRALGLTEAQRQDLIENKANLWLDSGAMFGPDGEGFERFNVACPRSVLKQAFEQLEAAVNSL